MLKSPGSPSDGNLAETETPHPTAVLPESEASGGQVPISVSEGDFSTPPRRTRTITRPRGLKTLESPAAASLPEAISVPAEKSVSSDGGWTEPSGATRLPGEETSAVDEFLAAPPTPVPETEDTPPPVAIQPNPLPPVSGELRPPAAIENPLDVFEMRRSALGILVDDALLDLGMAPSGALASAETPAALPTAALETHDVDSLLAQVADTLSHDAPSTEVVGPPSLGPLGDLSTPPPASIQLRDEGLPLFSSSDSPAVSALEDPIANILPLPSKAPIATVTSAPELLSPSLELTELSGEPPVAEEIPLQVSGRAHGEAALSPLALTLAHMAEALQAEMPDAGADDIELVDGPLVAVASSDTQVDPPASRSNTPPPVPKHARVPGPTKAPSPVQTEVPEALAERPRRPKRSRPWFEEIFDENYLRTLPFMTSAQTIREVDFIEASLGLAKGARVLDVGCGYGRHAIELVQRSLAVTGLDLSLPLLIRAAEEAQRRELTVDFVHGDMRQMAFDRQFDGAYCMLTSFGYFDDESNAKVAEALSRALKPGARLLLDVVNRDYVIADLPARIWWEGDGCVVLEEVEFNFNTNRLLTHRSVVFEDGRQLDQEISVRTFCLHDLGKLLRQAGFRILEVSGSIFTRGHFFGAASRNLLVVAERRAD